ncbi:TetR/AcrR family transcriptional regulator [Calditrichota bacterium]
MLSINLNEQNILASAEEVFKRHGYQKSTIQDVCKGAGLSKPTFYNYFKDKSELFSALVIHISEQLVKDWQNNLPDGLTPKETLSAFVDFYTDEVVTNPLFHAIFEDAEAMHQFSSALMQNPQSPIFNELKQIIDDGIASMQFRPHDSKASVWLIYSLLDSIFLLLPLMMRQPVGEHGIATVQEVKDFILKGVGNIE